MQTLTIFIIAFLLSGCVGVATMHNIEKKHEDLNFKLMGRGFLFDYQEKNHNYSKSHVIEIWGEPDSKEVGSSVEYWRYKQEGLAWAGVIPMIVIPIPLVVPVGRNSVTWGLKAMNLYRLQVSIVTVVWRFVVCSSWITHRALSLVVLVAPKSRNLTSACCSPLRGWNLRSAALHYGFKWGR